jgi:hypothetical protein
MSTYSPSLRIELITTGTQAGTWGNTTNTNLGGLIESAIAGYVSVSITSANQALTALNGAPDESRNQAIALTTTTTAAFAVYAPPAEKTYVIYNASAYAATIYNSTILGNTIAAGAGVTIPAGATMTVWSDGTNFALQNTHFVGTGAFTTLTASTNLSSTRINPRTSSTASTATLTPDISAFDQYNLTAQAAGLTVAAPTGTPVDGNKLIIRILDNGTSRTISWNATYTVIGTILPTATVVNKMLYVGCIYNAANTRWDVVAAVTQV